MEYCVPNVEETRYARLPRERQVVPLARFDPVPFCPNVY